MLDTLLRSLLSGRFYALLLPLAWFAWGAATGTRLLGDDNESTETLRAGSASSGRSRTGHARFYHK